MNIDNIRRAYPDCLLAVIYCEVILDQPSDEDSETSFELLRRIRPPVTPVEALYMIQVGMANEIREGDGCLRGSDGKTVYLQTKHSSFLNYLAAKLGML
jgi:hypothetical protein